MVKHDGTGRAEIEAREQAATRAADVHYTRLHLARHDQRVPYRDCSQCKAVGWR